MKAWIFEDISAQGVEIKHTLASAHLQVDEPIRHVNRAIGTVPLIQHDDIVTLDSQMPADENEKTDTESGLRIGLSIRAHGKGCGLLWFSSRPLPPELARLGALEVASFSSLPDDVNRVKAQPSFGHPVSQDWIDFAKNELKRISRDFGTVGSPWYPFKVLFALCQGYLVQIAYAQSGGGDSRTANPVWMDWMQDKLRVHAAEERGRRSQDLKEWFELAVATLRKTSKGGDLTLPEPPDAVRSPSTARDKLYACLEIPRYKKRYECLASGDSQTPCQERTYFNAGAAVLELCRCLLRHDSEGAPPTNGWSEEWYNRVSRGCLGLELLRLVHL